MKRCSLRYTRHKRNYGCGVIYPPLPTYRLSYVTTIHCHSSVLEHNISHGGQITPRHFQPIHKVLRTRFYLRTRLHAHLTTHTSTTLYHV